MLAAVPSCCMFQQKPYENKDMGRLALGPCIHDTSYLLRMEASMAVSKQGFVRAKVNLEDYH